jgi:hypothetical protein
MAENPSSMGASSVHYAERYGTLSLIIEVPLWTNPDSADDSPCDQRRAEITAATAGLLHDACSRIDAAIDPALDATTAPTSPFARTLAELRRNMPALAAALRDQQAHAGDAPVTVAERFAARQLTHTLRLRACGTALRLLEDVIGDGGDTQVAKDARLALGGLFTTWANEADAEAPGILVPLHRLVGAQLGAILTTAAIADETNSAGINQTTWRAGA